MHEGPRNAWRPGSGIATLLRLYAYLGPRWAQALTAFLAVFAVTAITIAQPQLIRWIVDRGIAHGDGAFLFGASVAFLALAAAKGLLVYVQGRSVEIASQGVAYDLRKELHERLTALSFSFHDKSQSGQLLSRAVQDVERIRFMTGKVTLRLAEGTVLLTSTLAVLFSMSLPLSFFVAPAIPILVWRAFRLGALSRPLGLEVQEGLARITTRLEQNLRGARIVKAFAQEEEEARRFASANESWFDSSRRQGSLQAIHGSSLNLIADLSLVVAVGAGGSLAIRGELSLGELVAFTAYLTQLAQPVRLMGVVAPVVGMAIASGERLFDIIDAEGEVVESPDALDLPPLEGRIRFESVSFGYRGRQRSIQNLSFEIAPGEVVACLGATGSGKSTLMNLIPRFYDVCDGSILVDGRDIRKATLYSLRSQIGIVLQEATLFALSVRENIAFGAPGADEDAIVGAAKAAQAHDFILALPEGYDTVVGERGATLSGGQRQRIAIARAILKDPRILLLDDATSSVDAGTEGLIQESLGRLMRGRTCIVIAHRASTLQLADRVIVLDRGAKVADGRHDELMASSRHYADLFKRQFRGGEAAR